MVSAGAFLGQIGGGQSYTQDLVSEFYSRGHEVFVLDPSSRDSIKCPPKEILPWKGAIVYKIQFDHLQESKKEQYSGLGAKRISFLEHILSEIKPDVVQINSLMPSMVRACNNLGIKYYVVAHHPGEVCPKGDLLTIGDTICTSVPSSEVCIRCVYATNRKSKMVGKLLSYLPNQFLLGIGGYCLKNNAFGYIGRVFANSIQIKEKIAGLQAYLRESMLVVAPSQAIANSLVRAGLNEGRLRTILHGIKRTQASETLGLERRPVKFGFVGRIDHAKGIHILLEAMQQSDLGSRAELHIYGMATNSRDEEEWSKICEKYKSEAWLHLHGPFEYAQREKIYQGIDVLVLPAIYLEVFGLVVAEALSAGRPVLATNCGGPAEQITHGVNGWIVDPNNVDALSDKLIYLANNKKEIERASLVAPKTVRDHSSYVDQIETLFT